MGCPTCGIDYKEIGDKAICPKCGRSRGYKQIDWVQILAQYETLKKRETEYVEEIKQLKKTITQTNKELSRMPPKQRRINP